MNTVANQVTEVQNVEAKKLEALCYEDKDSKGRTRTIYFSYIGDESQEVIDLKIAKLEAEGHANVRALTWSEYTAIDAEESKIRYNVNVPSVIDRDRFWELLEVLPPCRWERYQDFEAFYVSECITGNLYTFCVRIGNGQNAQYFEIVAESNINYTTLRQLCLEALNKPVAA